MSRRLSLVLCLCLGTTLGASCDGPAEPTDAGLDGGGLDAGSACEGAADGTECDDAAGGICVAGVCAASRCGDGYVAAGEQCDDGNDEAFDGCEPVTCAFTCMDDAICDDTDPCNGAETCSSDHRCVTDAEPLAEGAACTTGSIADGVCRLAATGSECVAAGCGNEVVEATEDCDDGANGDDDDGCRDDCAYTCADDAACGDDGDVCNGIERCDLTVHRCLVDTPPSPAWYVDCDGDGFAANTDGTREGCTAPPESDTGCTDPSGGWVAVRPAGITTTDCDDGDDARHPGATESCDDLDDDCDAAIDEGLATTTYYLDADGDDYGTSTSVSACARPDGYATNSDDCCDGDADAHPGQASYFSVPTDCGGYDYDCSGSATRQYPSGFSGCTWSVAQCTGGWGYDCTTTGFSPGWGRQSGGAEGYLTTSAPACGALGTFVTTCGIDPNGNNTYPCGGQDYCEFGRSSRSQACR